MVSCTADVEGFEAVLRVCERTKEKLPEGKLPAQEQIKAVGLKNEGFPEFSRNTVCGEREITVWQDFSYRRAACPEGHYGLWISLGKCACERRALMGV